MTHFSFQECPPMRKLQAAALVVSALSFTAACSSNDNNDNDLTDAQTQQVGGALSSQITSLPTAFTATDLSSGNLGGGFFLARALGVRGIGAPPKNFRAPCPSVDDATDTDGDGVPDDATYTFVLADCSSTNFEVSGTIRLVDPSPTAVGYNGTFTDFLLKLLGNGSDFASIKLDGTHSVLGTPGSATLSENMVTTVNAQDNGESLTGSLSNNWSVTFTPAVGQNLEMDTPLPDGAFSVNGTFVYNVNGQHFSFGVQTQAPLQYDSACDIGFPFSSGELRARVGGPNGRAYVKVTYTACGTQPTVEFFGANS
jgi:hypothetical protein